MPVEIIPPPESVCLKAPIEFKGRLKPTPLGLVPEGYDAYFKIVDLDYEVHDFRARPGHEPGAQVIVRDEVNVRLGTAIDTVTINNILFRWSQS